MGIVQATVKSSELFPTTLIGEDTNLLILYYAQLNNRGLYFRTDKSTLHKIYNISEMKRILNSKACSQLCIRVYIGCDSTSHIFGVGIFDVGGYSTIFIIQR